MGGALGGPLGEVEAARRSLAFCSGRSRLAADNTKRVRVATCDSPQTRDGKKKKEGGSWEAEPQKISMTKGGVMVKVRKRRWWSTNSKKMRYVDDVVHGGVENNNHHKG